MSHRVQTVLVFEDLDELSRAALEGVIAIAQDAIRERGVFRVLLSGGSTPKALYELMARHARRVDWTAVELYWGDERNVAGAHPGSNYAMVDEALLRHLEDAPSVVARVVPQPGSPTEAASNYETVIRKHCGDPLPRFDLALQGLGTDGHTASLFPGDPSVSETKRWVCASESPVEPFERITVTVPVLCNARNVYFLVAGENKSGPLKRVLEGDVSPKEHPAVAVYPTHGSLTWWVDRDAIGATK